MLNKSIDYGKKHDKFIKLAERAISDKIELQREDKV